MSIPDSGSDASIASKKPSVLASVVDRITGRSGSSKSSSSPSDSSTTPSDPDAQESSRSQPSSSGSSRLGAGRTSDFSGSSEPSSSASSSPTSAPSPRSGASIGRKGEPSSPASDVPMGSITPGNQPGSLAWSQSLNAELERYARSSGVAPGRFAQPPLGPVPMQPTPSAPDAVPTGNVAGGDDPDAGLLRSLNAIISPANAGAVKKLTPSAAGDDLPDPDRLPGKS